ncbi:MAG TPA: 3-hydroxyacyl-ACP dehydratase FabZ [Stellaceae bacterium]|jgi:3-hydroxyacyl-[acyl-carrier-protein] dehydratase|nr:3-hydroxyacyl-ACP dehydratase FabZ [Stellaceae bacterium]
MEAAQAGQQGEMLGIERIKQLIPHREPFLLIDHVADILPGASAVGIKQLTGQEDFFRGHFPRRKLMPGVLIIETMAQTAAVLVVHTLGPSAEGKLVYFMSVEKARFRKPVVPGDELRVKVVCLQNRGRVWKFDSLATVGGTRVAEATFTAMVVD